MIRALVFATVSLASSAPVLAQTDALARCRTMSDGPSRLACYDAIPLAAPTAPQALNGPAAAPSAAVSAPADFGMPKRDRTAAPEGIDSVIPGNFSGWEPKTRWRLANGQVWEVIEGSHGAYELRDPKVRIRRGIVGNYLMEIDGVAQVLKVRRIQ